MAEQKYWITPKGEIIKISQHNINEHFKFFNDSELGREMKLLYNINIKFKPDNLYLAMLRGFIRVLELNEILNISYSGHSMGNPIPVSPEARDSLFTFLFKPEITEVQYDVFIGSKSVSELISKKEFVKFFENILNFDQSLIDRILKLK